MLVQMVPQRMEHSHNKSLIRSSLPKPDLHWTAEHRLAGRSDTIVSLEACRGSGKQGESQQCLLLGAS